MRAFRSSIVGTMMMVTVAAGLYGATIRALPEIHPAWLGYSLFTTLPMLVLMALAGLAVIVPGIRKPGPRPFLAGFAAFGAVAEAAALGFFFFGGRWAEMILLATLKSLSTRLTGTGGPSGDPFWGMIGEVTVIPLTLSLPQMVFAALGGWLNARYRVTITRRRDG